MDLNDKNLSIQFYNNICDIVGSEEVVRTRRDIFTAKDIVQNARYTTFISSGSKAEGIDLKGSDYDHMIQLRSFRVYESSTNVQSDPHKIILVMNTIDIKQGYTKLKLFKKSYLDIDIICNWCETTGEETYISSKRVRERYLLKELVIHGPCQSLEGKYDRAVCFRCKEWITPAQQWIHRSRTSWPHYTLVTSAIQYGVLFVPIGCKNSPNEDLQWRISFSVTEKLLIYSFSHTQLLCYALMKIMLKDLIKPEHGDLLCSYFLKTIMFWLSEEISPTEWKPENMISCFLNCMRRLIYCVEYKTCLHYFISEINLFEDRFDNDQHKALLETLQAIYRSPWMSVFSTITCQTFILNTLHFGKMTLTASELSCFSYISLFLYNENSIHMLCKRLFRGYDYMLKKEMWLFMLCVCFRKSIHASDYLGMRDRNKSFYKKYLRTLCYFKISLHRNSISSWLLLASLFYKCKRFHECQYMINYCLFSCTQDKILLQFENNWNEQSDFKKIRLTLGLLHAFKYLVTENVCFRYPFCLLPNELESFITEERLDIFIPPIVYSYLLQFLCCHHLKDERGKHNAMHKIEQEKNGQYLMVPSQKNLKTVIKSLEVVKALL